MSKTSGKPKSQKKIIGEYEVYLDKVLGVGGFGKVLEGFDTKKKEKVAVKMIKKDHSGEGAYQLKALEREFMIQYRLSSNHIVGLKDIISTKNYNYIIQQKCDQDLQGYLTRHKRISEEHAIEFMAQILQGFYALIVTNVIHRDVKPQNILIKDGMLKLTDFGLSRKISNDELMTSVVGTKIYKAPQLIQGSTYTTKCDIWSLGTLFYEMLFGAKLFGKIGSDLKVLSQMREIDKHLDFPIQPQISQESKTILRKCLRFKEEDRADWNYLFNHPLFAKKVPNLDKLQIGLNQIISIIRKQIDTNNIDLEKFFKRFGFSTNSELKFDTYSSMILKLISFKKISIEQIRFSFNYFDRDGSGKITFNEFYNTLQKYDVKMVATARDQMLSKLVTVVSKIQDKDTETSGNDSNLIDFDESYSKQEMDLLNSSEKAYHNLICQLKNKDVNIVQAFHLQDIAELGLDLIQFQQFLSEKLGVSLTQNQSKLIFEKLDEDKSKKIEAKEFFKFVCQDLNIPYLIDQDK